MTRPGLIARQLLPAQAELFQHAGTEILDQDVGPGDQFVHERAPSGCFRLTVTDFLLRACTYHHSEVPSYSLRHLRSGSPPSGDSILITSAPNSARMRVQNGPAIRVPIR